MSDAAAATPAELEAATRLHHDLFTGLVLGVAGHHGQAAAGAFLEATFRRQHDARFLPGLQTLGLAGLPPAVACARFIVLANRAGGLDVGYHEEGPRKAWVHYPPPRWAYEGPAICALDNRVSEGFLRGFHARCGASLGNPRLRFVCTGMTTNGDPGLTGCFEECDAPVGADGALVIRLGAPSPRFRAGDVPPLPWPQSRLPVSRRNYAVAYIENMLPALVEQLGEAAAVPFIARIARLVGLQAYAAVAAVLRVERGGADAFAMFLQAVNRGAGNALATGGGGPDRVRLERYRAGQGRLVFDCWSAMLAGALAVHDPDLRLEARPDWPGWRVAPARVD